MKDLFESKPFMTGTTPYNWVDSDLGQKDDC